MTLATTTNRIDYRGDGSVVEFPVPFLFLDDSHLQVYTRDVETGEQSLKVITTHYTVTGAGDVDGGTVTFGAAPDALSTVTILRVVPLDQLLAFTANGPFPAADHEAALDKLTMIVQQLQEHTSRAVALDVTDTSTPPDVTDLTVVRSTLIGQITGPPVAGEHPFEEVEPTAAGSWSTKSGGVSGDAAENNGCDADFTDKIVPITRIMLGDTTYYRFPTPGACPS